MSDPKYPESVTISVDRTGIAPKELRAIRKCAGGGYDELDVDTQLQAAGFIALMRLFPDDDLGVLWEQADETYVKPPEGVVEVNPPSGDG